MYSVLLETIGAMITFNLILLIMSNLRPRLLKNNSILSNNINALVVWRMRTFLVNLQS
jgi:hypothetical protein